MWLIVKILFLMFFMLLIMFSMNLNYLSFLIGMEYMVILVLFLILNNQVNMWFFLLYLVYSVSEAVLGLSLLISMNFDFGHQKLILLNLY